MSLPYDGELVDDDWDNRGSYHRTKEEISEEAYLGKIDSLLQTFLVNPRTAILPPPANESVNTVRLWVLRLRAAQLAALQTENQTHSGPLTPKSKTKTRNSDVRYAAIVVTAIKLAFTTGCVVELDTRLRAVKQAPERLVLGRTDSRIPPPSLQRLIDLAIKSDTHLLDIKEDHGTLAMTTVYRQLCRDLRVSFSAMDTTLSVAMHILDRIERALKIAISSPPSSTSSAPYWQGDRSAYFPPPGPAWKTILETAYHIYELQTTVSLFAGRAMAPTALALAVCAIEAVVGKEVPNSTEFTAMVGEWVGQSPYAARERCREFHMMCVAWSTSLQDAGLKVPQLLPPPRGGLGDGLRYYSGQRNRSVPPRMIYAASALTIARNWRILAKTRLRTRLYALPLDDEITYARQMFALNGMKGTPPRWPPAPGTGPASLNSQIMDLLPAPAEPTLEDLLAMEGASSDEDEQSVASSSAGLEEHGNIRADSGTAGRPFPLLTGAVDSTPASVDYVSIGTPMSRTPSTASTTQYTSASDTESDSSTNRFRRLLHGSKRGHHSRRAASAANTTRSSSVSTAVSVGSSSAAYQRYLREASCIDDASLPHAGVLVREREEYVGYQMWKYRQRGLLVSAVVEAAMLKWYGEQVERGSIPRVIDEDYITALGIPGDVRKVNLEPFIADNRWRWSPTESLLRAGVKPTEFPIRYIPTSLTSLAQQLEHYNSDELAPLGPERIDEVQLDRELDILFPPGTQSFKSLLNDEREQAQRAKVLAEYDEYLQDLAERSKHEVHEDDDDDDDRWDPLRAIAEEEKDGQTGGEFEADRLREATLMAILRRGQARLGDEEADDEDSWDRMFELDAEPRATGSRRSKGKRTALARDGDATGADAPANHGEAGGKRRKGRQKHRGQQDAAVGIDNDREGMPGRKPRKGKGAVKSNASQSSSHAAPALISGGEEVSVNSQGHVPASSFGVPPSLAPASP